MNIRLDRRLLAVALVVILAVPVEALARTVVHKGPRKTTVVHRNRTRTKVVVHRHFPLRRAFPNVIVRPARTVVRVAPAVFLAPVVFAPLVVARPVKDVIVWEDTERIEKDEEWTEVTLNADARGSRLFLDVDGKAQLSFAEVVFENGDAQVVDFADKDVKSGTYALLNFKDGRKVDHVRVVAKAKSDEAGLTLLLEK